jgi:hypothetical protein
MLTRQGADHLLRTSYPFPLCVICEICGSPLFSGFWISTGFGCLHRRVRSNPFLGAKSDRWDFQSQNLSGHHPEQRRRSDPCHSPACSQFVHFDRRPGRPPARARSVARSPQFAFAWQTIRDRIEDVNQSLTKQEKQNKMKPPSVWYVVSLTRRNERKASEMKLFACGPGVRRR